MTQRSLDELRATDSLYRPTSFWGPGLDALLADMDKRGLETFKSWPSSGWWFYSPATASASPTPSSTRCWRPSIRSCRVLATSWDPVLARCHPRGSTGLRCPPARLEPAELADLNGLGESTVGALFQYYKFTRAEHGWTRPYLNYGSCMVALSQHVDAPPQRFLEIGGGFGVPRSSS